MSILKELVINRPAIIDSDRTKLPSFDDHNDWCEQSIVANSQDEFHLNTMVMNEIEYNLENAIENEETDIISIIAVIVYIQLERSVSFHPKHSCT
jgi:hypothetical protein